MSTAAFSLFFSLLALAALAGAVAVGVLAVGLRGGRGDGLRYEVGRIGLPVAWVVATVTTLGSLYYSKVVGFPPCELCWYQRIAVYPLVVILGTALVRRDAAGVRPYALGLCLVGLPVSIYHSWIQWFPPDEGTSFCTLDAPCTAKYVFELGFVTLPFMAGCAFVSIIAFLLATRWAFPPASAGEQNDHDDHAHPVPHPEPLVPETAP
jgi:disulfide bond formation protein DsbB